MCSFLDRKSHEGEHSVLSLNWPTYKTIFINNPKYITVTGKASFIPLIPWDGQAELLFVRGQGRSTSDIMTVCYVAEPGLMDLSILLLH